MKETCSNCRFGHTIQFESDAGPAVNTFCREDTPKFIPPNSSGLLPVNPDGWCGKWQIPPSTLAKLKRKTS